MLRRGLDVKKTLRSTGGLIVLFLILVLVNAVLGRANVRWDLTEAQSYSLSHGTDKILASLPEPVTVQLYYSASNPGVPAQIKIYARRVEDFLREYERAARGRLTLEMVDPKPDSDEEEWAQKYGLEGIQLSDGSSLYLGLVFLAADREAVIEWLDPSREQLLEYDLTRLIQRVAQSTPRVVGILSSLPVFGRMQRSPLSGQPEMEAPWYFVSQLREDYTVKEIAPDTTRIDPAIELLVVVHPKELGPNLEYAIDQYIVGGGNALIFVDPLCLSDPGAGPQGYMMPTRSSSLPMLFKAWGLSMDSQSAIADLDQATRVRAMDNSIESNPMWISARQEAFDPDDVITSMLESMLLPVAGALERDDGAPYEMKTLVHSSANAGLIDPMKFSFGAQQIRREFTPADHPLAMAVRLTGQFKTAYPEGAPKLQAPGREEGAQDVALPAGEHRGEGTETATVIVVSDVDLLADEFYLQKGEFLGMAISKIFNDNLNFFGNAAEVLTGGNDLIDLRARGKFERPFTVVLGLQAQAQARWLAKEQELVMQAEVTTNKLRELEQQKDASQKMIMSPEQEAEIDKFREERRRVNAELKKVRKNLRADIETLGVAVKAVNIFLMPFCVAIAGAVFGIYRQRRMKAR